ncbi:MAG: COX15/CtaA family protein [Alphaproteobacteria bacterium]|nr:COX15/CtaA family protein [Alphaproteobacteria bacterium]
MAISFGTATGTKSAERVVQDRRAIAQWLFGMSGMVFLMVVIGGITRLTESGLSMTEWRALHDTFPPLSEAEWQRQFALYMETPEFQIRNFWMTVDDYKTIYWWEWIHRTWGRLIGAAFLLPFLWFWVRGRIERALMPRLVFMLILGGLQGGIGWWMVKSGLVDEPDVSQYRLAVHLTMAFIIQAVVFWTALDLWRGTFKSGQPVRLKPLGLSALVLFVVVTGAFVAGTDAGYIYNTFPLMGGQVVPEAYWSLPGGLVNLVENPAAIQFNHRLVAVLTFGLIVAYTVSVLRNPESRTQKRAALAFVHMVVLQVVLGISTLMVMGPEWLETDYYIAFGAAHQGGAYVLFTLALLMTHVSRQSVSNRV